MINFDVVDFSQCRSNEVIRLFDAQCITLQDHEQSLLLLFLALWTIPVPDWQPLYRVAQKECNNFDS